VGKRIPAYITLGSVVSYLKHAQIALTTLLPYIENSSNAS